MWNTALLLVLFASSLYYYVRHVYSYWRRNGFPQVKPHIPAGCMMPSIKKKRTAAWAIADTYYESTEPFVGIYVFFVPQVMVRDIELVRRILIDDFEYFTDHDIYINHENDPLSVNLLSEKGQRWRDTRALLTPLFTAAKLKAMFPTFVTGVEKLDKTLEQHVRDNKPISLQTIGTHFVLNVVVSVLFGIEVDLDKDPNHTMKRMFHLAGRPENFKEHLRQSASFFLPGLLKLFKIHNLPAEVREYFTEVVNTTIEFREKNNFRRNDFLQLFIDLRKSSDGKLSVQEIAGNTFLFFLAGTETSVNLIMYFLYEVSRNPEILKKAQLDVKHTMEKHNNEFTYEAFSTSDYVDLCMKETLRLYIPLAVQNRSVVKDYKIPGYNLTLKKGSTVLLPYGPLALNADYFPRPKEFIPERFEKDSGMADEKAYFPFGGGPRNCLAWKMGLLETKVAIVKILHKYNLELLTKTKITPNAQSLTGLPNEEILIQLSFKDN